MKYMYQNIRKLLLHILIPAVLLMMLFPATVKAAEPTCEVSIPVRIQVSGNNVPNGVPYTIVMERITPEAPMPAEGTITLENAGDIMFGPIIYTAVGEYQYKIIQNSAPRSYFTFDQTVYTITVRIGNAPEGGLTAEVWAVSGSEEVKADEVVFNNKYYRSGGGGSGGSGGSGGGGGGTVVVPDGLTTIGDGTTPLSNIIENLIPEGLVPLSMMPKTGDTTQVVLWIFRILASGFGLLLLMTYRRRVDSNMD